MKSRVFTGTNLYVYTVGDLHGDYEHFRKSLTTFEKTEKDSLLLFLGDYADRGLQGLEIVTELNSLLDSRRDIIALKGNHEMYLRGRPLFSPCDLPREAEFKYSSWEEFYREVMLGFFAKLHTAALINSTLFVHGGIFSGIKTAEDLEKPENETNLLWSDPSPVPGEHPNPRGAGMTFGEDITKQVLSSLRVKIMVRSHEPGKAADGPCSEQGGKVVTTNACTSYGEPWKPFVLKVNTVEATYTPIFL